MEEGYPYKEIILDKDHREGAVENRLPIFNNMKIIKSIMEKMEGDSANSLQIEEYMLASKHCQGMAPSHKPRVQTRLLKTLAFKLWAHSNNKTTRPQAMAASKQVSINLSRWTSKNSQQTSNPLAKIILTNRCTPRSKLQQLCHVHQRIGR